VAQRAASAPLCFRVTCVRQLPPESPVTGTYVNTLSMPFNKNTFPNTTRHLVRSISTSFSPVETLWCHDLGGGFVVCKGVVSGTAPAFNDPDFETKCLVARLPQHLRPLKELHFAALCRRSCPTSDGHATYTSHLVTVVVTADGWIKGIGTYGELVEGNIDLSAIRFCNTKGIALMDRVTLHILDVCGTRLVCLQGSTVDHYFKLEKHKPLALLPESCRPPADVPYIVAGGVPGRFHLLLKTRIRCHGYGGDVRWRDSSVNHDKLHFTGIMYEVGAEALLCKPFDTKMTQVFIDDFQRFLKSRFGDVDTAYDQVFDTDGNGCIDFTEFGRGCKMCGYVGNATRLWNALDVDRDGELSREELGARLEMLSDLPGTMPLGDG